LKEVDLVGGGVTRAEARLAPGAEPGGLEGGREAEREGSRIEFGQERDNSNPPVVPRVRGVALFVEGLDKGGGEGCGEALGKEAVEQAREGGEDVWGGILEMLSR
jgi:hypothetical protein